MSDLPGELEAMLTVDCRLVCLEESFLFGDSGVEMGIRRRLYRCVGKGSGIY